MSTRKVVLTELSLYDNAIPLLNGYLEAYARKAPEVGDKHSFISISHSVKKPASDLALELEALDADVYGFSCYVWNMGTIRVVAQHLAREKPSAKIVLGGHQAANQAARYLLPERDNMYICDGEGERTFTDFLRASSNGQNSMRNVRGLSFYEQGELVTTPPQTTLRDLDEIPSPYLTGVFEKKPYNVAVFETNRGCPYECSFCTWGGPGKYVAQFSLDRIYEELEWLSSAGVIYLHLADANWGMLKRDVNISKRIGELYRENHKPLVVAFSAAKNKTQGSIACVETLNKAGIVTTQAVGVQTMSQTVLDSIDRSNIPSSKYIEMFEGLEKQGIGSFAELMFPLPNETYASLRDSVAQLCKLKTGAIVLYPTLLTNNAKMSKNREKWGCVSVPSTNEADEIEIVIGSSTVSAEDYLQAMWFYFAGAHPIYNARALHCTAQLLMSKGKTTFDGLFHDFAHYMRVRKDHPYSAICHDMFDNLRQHDMGPIGCLAHAFLHELRQACLQALCDFAATQSWWDDNEARTAFEIDLLNMPHLYSNTPVTIPDRTWEFIRPTQVDKRIAYVEIQTDAAQSALQDLLLRAKRPPAERRQVQIDYSGPGQMPHSRYWPADQVAGYCHGMMQRVNAILPTWKSAA